MLICVAMTGCICAFFLICTILWAHAGNGVSNQNFDWIAVLVIWGIFLIRSFEFQWKRLFAIGRLLLGIMFVILAYFVIHFATIGFLPSFLSLAGGQ